MNSGQTKTQIQYFPIKAFQPELVCNVIFASENDWQNWQTWARTNMVNAQNSNNTGSPGVTLNWPERNINNWIGIIPSIKAGGMRRNYTPRTRVEFQLVTSLVSNLAIFASFGSAWQGIFGSTVVGSTLDSIFTLPESIQGGATTSGNAGTLLGSGVVTSLATAAGGLSSLIPGLGGLLGAL